MPRIARSVHVSHTAEQMYRLVLDVPAYPAFLPGCSAARIDEQSETHQVATVVAAKSLKQTHFTTRNRLEPGEAIHVTLVNGPFERLEGTWRFTDLGDAGCQADLEVEFTFASRLLGAVMGPAFTQVCDSLVKAFLRRADVVYGEPGRAAPS